MNPSAAVSLSLVIPCYNEAEVLPQLATRLSESMSAIGLSWEVILIDDGSSDSTWGEIIRLHESDPRFKGLAFSRNFGHQPAVLAGLTAASGESVAVLDADLQDPPELIGACLQMLAADIDVVYAVRRTRQETICKRLAYRGFYRLLRLLAEVPIPLDSGDFCVMKRSVVDVIIAMPERNIFARGLRAWAGFRQVAIEYDRAARAAGETKYSFAKLCRLAADGLFSFSIAPLRLAIYAGFATMLMAIIAIVFVVIWRVTGFRFMGHISEELPGWSAVIAALLFLSGVQLLILGFMGEYIGRIYNEVKCRPRWVARDSCGGLRQTSMKHTESRHD